MNRILLTLPFLLCLGGCTELQVLDAIIATGKIAVPILDAAGQPLPATILGYVGSTLNCVAQQTGNPTPVQLVNISVCLTAVAAPEISAAVPTEVANVINKLIQDVNNYIAAYPRGKMMARPGVKPANIKFGRKAASQFLVDRAAAQDLVQRMDVVSAKHERLRYDHPKSK